MTFVGIEQTEEYRLAKELLSPKLAKRSGVSYFLHIEEGLRVMQNLEHSLIAQQAYCLHPVVQNTNDFLQNFKVLSTCDSLAVALAVEYRWVANNGTRHVVMDNNWQIELSDIREVNQMLLADKVQNRKNFLRYYDRTDDANFDQLDRYFKLWMEYLHISEDEYVALEIVCSAGSQNG